MKLAFENIPLTKTHYQEMDPKWFHISELTFNGPLKAKLTLQRKNDQTVFLTGIVNVDVKFECDRCGEDFLYQLNTEYYYIFKQGEDNHLSLKEVECSVDDCHTVYLKEPVIDVSDVLREQILLAIPERRICNDECKGICLYCGIELNKETCKCSGDSPHSPFAVLKQLKKH